ncbi:transaldolase [Gammaproteobacteria bacterium 45_16_T64]|nr:transaldolase [Gammaproteobacteria bacterium 45_16_T64]
MSDKLTQLKAMTEVVADTGDIEAIKQYRPQDATTNPSLVLKAFSLSQYEPLILRAIQQSQGDASDAADRLAVLIGVEILNIVPGKVSTEVDSRLSFNTAATIEKARKLIKLYEDEGISRNRILIKIAATWEGIQAASTLEADGIQCNLTLLFGFAQAVACAEAGATLISPFVGRILDWYKQNTENDGFTPETDPGVLSVKAIYDYYKTFDYQTIVMGASFRNPEEIEQLAGCDKLTISPAIMQALAEQDTNLEQKLSVNDLPTGLTKISMNESVFRWMMNEDAMATEKLAEGIRNFTKDQITLESLLVERINSAIR